MPEIADHTLAEQPRVLSVYEGFFSGGARILHTDAVIGLQELGMDQAAYSINEAMYRENTEQSMYGDRSYMALAAAGIEVATMGRHSDAGRPPAPFSEFEVQQFRHRVGDVDVILSLKEQPVGLISEAGADGRPVIACLHRSDPEADPLALGNLVDAVEAGTVTACICCAQSTKAAYEAAGIDGSRLEVITNGIDLDRFSTSDEARSRIREEAGVPGDVPVVTFAARFDGIKKVPLFIASAAEYLRENEDAHVMMCGAGMTLDNGELRGLIRAAFDGEDAAGIHALGIRDDMEAVYAAADVVSLTSRREAYPLSLIEGMASGAVPVATGVGDVGQILEGRGIVTDDDPAEIAAAWDQAYARRGEFQAGFRRSAEQFGRDRMISSYAKFINQVYRLQSGEEEAVAAAG